MVKAPWLSGRQTYDAFDAKIDPGCDILRMEVKIGAPCIEDASVSIKGGGLPAPAAPQDPPLLLRIHISFIVLFYCEMRHKTCMKLQRN